MKKFKISLSKHEQYILKAILTDLVDKDNPFQLETLPEHACGVHEALKWLVTLNYTQPYKHLRLQYFQLAILWKIIYCYPANDESMNEIRLLLNHIDKYFLTIQTQLNYEVQAQTFQSNANLLI